MTYEDLPYEYKNYATTKGWEDAQALAYWQQAAEYREYLIGRITAHMSIWICSTSKKAGRMLATYNTALHNIRGFRAKVT